MLTEKCKTVVADDCMKVKYLFDEMVRLDRQLRDFCICITPVNRQWYTVAHPKMWFSSRTKYFQLLEFNGRWDYRLIYAMYKTKATFVL